LVLQLTHLLFELLFFAFDRCQNVHEASAENLSQNRSLGLDMTARPSNLAQ
jgi:hypothetical protein